MRDDRRISSRATRLVLGEKIMSSQLFMNQASTSDFFTKDLELVPTAQKYLALQETCAGQPRPAGGRGGETCHNRGYVVARYLSTVTWWG